MRNKKTFFGCFGVLLNEYRDAITGGGRKSNNTGNQVSSLTRAVSPPDELLGDMAIDARKRTCKILINRGTFEMEDCYLLMEYCNTVQLLYDANQKLKAMALVMIPLPAVRNLVRQ
ncbi:hypothetical protein [Klebsiella michiganensis]|uniref:hypothetical protein n=1 Tax=Klebsiella michiganensis TaxID=1134687 RepID=UPI00388D52E2